MNNDIPFSEKDISITELYNADQVFTTGTMGELAIVEEIDGRKISVIGETFTKIEVLFRNLTQKEGEVLPF